MQKCEEKYNNEAYCTKVHFMNVCVFCLSKRCPDPQAFHLTNTFGINTFISHIKGTFTLIKNNDTYCSYECDPHF